MIFVVIDRIEQFVDYPKRLLLVKFRNEVFDGKPTLAGNGARHRNLSKYAADTSQDGLPSAQQLGQAACLNGLFSSSGPFSRRRRGRRGGLWWDGRLAGLRRSPLWRQRSFGWFLGRLGFRSLRWFPF